VADDLVIHDPVFSLVLQRTKALPRTKGGITIQQQSRLQQYADASHPLSGSGTIQSRYERIFLGDVIAFSESPETPLLARHLVIEILRVSVTSHQWAERQAARVSAINFVIAWGHAALTQQQQTDLVISILKGTK